ncbi:hypothetical protein, partial [Asaia astilbis]|uniref:hypothetical protein n=1 Tax=Asaia astilbis TaxID=610244 RepID=UPI0018DE3688
SARFAERPPCPHSAFGPDETRDVLDAPPGRDRAKCSVWQDSDARHHIGTGERSGSSFGIAAELTRHSRTSHTHNVRPCFRRAGPAACTRRACSIARTSRHGTRTAIDACYAIKDASS